MKYIQPKQYMFPWTEHVESVVLMSRVKEWGCESPGK